MRRVMLLALLALGLPTVVFADSVTVIPVNNPSFETHPPLTGSCQGPGCLFSAAPIPGWTTTAGSGQVLPSVGTDGIFDTFAPNDGDISAFTNGTTISQQVGTKVQEGVIYTLTLDIGHRDDQTFGGAADLMLSGLNHPTETIDAKGNVPSPGHWSTFTATFVGNSSNVGDSITIQLTHIPGVSGQGNFDGVKLTATVTPEPGTVSLLGTGLIGLAGMARRKLKLKT